MKARELTVVKIKSVGENLKRWHLICHLQKDRNAGGEFFYRIFEYMAANRDDAEAKALELLRSIAKKLSVSRFTLILVIEGEYCGKSYGRVITNHSRTSAARERFRDPKEILGDWSFEQVFVRGNVRGFSERVVK